MKYYANIPFQYADHNRLDGAIKAMLKEFDDFVFEVKKLPVIKSSILNVIESLNKEYPRCKPVVARWVNNDTYESLSKKGAWILYLSSNEYAQSLKLTLCREESDL